MDGGGGGEKISMRHIRVKVLKWGKLGVRLPTATKETKFLDKSSIKIDVLTVFFGPQGSPTYPPPPPPPKQKKIIKKTLLPPTLDLGNK